MTEQFSRTQITTGQRKPAGFPHVLSERLISSEIFRLVEHASALPSRAPFRRPGRTSLLKRVEPSEPAFPPRQLPVEKTPREKMRSAVRKFFNWRWQLGMQPTIYDQPTPPKTKVTTFIPIHNEEWVLRPTLDAMLQQTLRPQIIAINDRSTDKSGEIIEEYAARYPGIVIPFHITHNTDKKAGALEQAVASGLATGDYYHFLDADTVCASDALEKALRPFWDPEVGATCMNVMPQEIDGKTSWATVAKLFEYLGSQALIKWAQDLWGGHLVMSGCSAIYAREAFIGFNNGCIAEDMATSIATRLMGWKTVYKNDAFCYPLEPVNLREWLLQRDRWTRGFLQCIAMFYQSLYKRPALAFWVAFMFFLGAADIFVLPIAVYAFTLNGVWALRASILDIATTVIAVTACGYYRGGWVLAWTALKAAPLSFFSMFLNKYVFWRSVFLEWILGRRLNIWHIGHSQGEDAVAKRPRLLTRIKQWLTKTVSNLWALTQREGKTQ